MSLHGQSVRKAPSMRRKAVLVKKVTLPADSALSSLCMRKMLTPALLPESTVLAHALIVSLSLKCFYKEELDRLEGNPTVQKGLPV